jgi:hypothetical protein
MGLEQRVRAMKRGARNSFYRDYADGYMGYRGHGITNWRMLIARRLRIPVAEVRRLLGEEPK